MCGICFCGTWDETKRESRKKRSDMQKGDVTRGGDQIVRKSEWERRKNLIRLLPSVGVEFVHQILHNQVFPVQVNRRDESRKHTPGEKTARPGKTKKEKEEKRERVHGVDDAQHLILQRAAIGVRGW
jgi:hypothetical protein